MINLILNAILHAFDGKESGTISIAVTKDNDEMNILFKDNGNGIDQTIRNKIFEPFITTKRGSGGSGLGLHLVYNLITQALDGSITIESEKNEGTQFIISFPLNAGNHYA